MDKNPNTIDEATQYVKSAVTNQRVILGTKKIDIKRVTFSEEECEESQIETEPQIRTMRLMERDNSNINKLEQRLKKTEDGLEETRAMVKDILKIVSKSPPRPVSPVRPRTENNKTQIGTMNAFVVEN